MKIILEDLFGFLLFATAILFLAPIAFYNLKRSLYLNLRYFANLEKHKKII